MLAGKNLKSCPNVRSMTTVTLVPNLIKNVVFLPCSPKYIRCLIDTNLKLVWLVFFFLLMISVSCFMFQNWGDTDWSFELNNKFSIFDHSFWVDRAEISFGDIANGSLIWVIPIWRIEIFQECNSFNFVFLGTLDKIINFISGSGCGTTRIRRCMFGQALLQIWTPCTLI